MLVLGRLQGYRPGERPAHRQPRRGAATQGWVGTQSSGQWQVAEPLSVNVLPATGTKRQS